MGMGIDVRDGHFRWGGQMSGGNVLHFTSCTSAGVNAAICQDWRHWNYRLARRRRLAQLNGTLLRYRDVSCTSTVLWVVTIRIPHAERCGRNQPFNDWYHCRSFCKLNSDNVELFAYSSSFALM